MAAVGEPFFQAPCTGNCLFQARMQVGNFHLALTFSALSLSPSRLCPTSPAIASCHTRALPPVPLSLSCPLSPLPDASSCLAPLISFLSSTSSALPLPSRLPCCFAPCASLPLAPSPSFCPPSLTPSQALDPCCSLPTATRNAAPRPFVSDPLFPFLSSFSSMFSSLLLCAAPASTPRHLDARPFRLETLPHWPTAFFSIPSPPPPLSPFFPRHSTRFQCSHFPLSRRAFGFATHQRVPWDLPPPNSFPLHRLPRVRGWVSGTPFCYHGFFRIESSKGKCRSTTRAAVRDGKQMLTRAEE